MEFGGGYKKDGEDCSRAVAEVGKGRDSKGLYIQSSTVHTIQHSKGSLLLYSAEYRV